MLANLVNDNIESIPGLNKYHKSDSRKNPGIMPMRRTKPEKNHPKHVLYTNMACPPDYWKIANGLMHRHVNMVDNSEIYTAVYQFSDEEWDFLQRASGELARLKRYSRVLPYFADMVSSPGKIYDNFVSGCGSYFPEVFYSSANGQREDNELRYGLAIYVAVAGEIFDIFSHHYDANYYARLVCTLLFSRPYRKDWLTCPLSEIEDDATFIMKTFSLHSCDFALSDWYADMRNFDHRRYRLEFLISHFQELRYLAKANFGDEQEFETKK